MNELSWYIKIIAHFVSQDIIKHWKSIDLPSNLNLKYKQNIVVCKTKFCDSWLYVWFEIFAKEKANKLMNNRSTWIGLVLLGNNVYYATSHVLVIS